MCIEYIKPENPFREAKKTRWQFAIAFLSTPVLSSIQRIQFTDENSVYGRIRMRLQHMCVCMCERCALQRLKLHAHRAIVI